jgi:hypothetical protein
LGPNFDLKLKTSTLWKIACFLRKIGHILTEFVVLGNLTAVVHVLDLLHQGDSRFDYLGAIIDYLNDQ